MPQAIGFALLDVVGATGSLTGIGSATPFVDLGFTSISAASLVGTAAIAGPPIGRCFELPRPGKKKKAR